MYDISQLNSMLVPELREIAQRIGVKGFRRLAKQDLIYSILDTQAANGSEEESKEEEGTHIQASIP